MGTYVNPLVDPNGAELNRKGRSLQVVVNDRPTVSIADDWGLSATASAGSVQLDVDEGLSDGQAYAATLVVGQTQVRFRMLDRGTIAAWDEFFAARRTRSELPLGAEAVIAWDDEFDDRCFLRVGDADAGVTLTLAGQTLCDCATCVSDAASQVAQPV